MTTPSRPHIHPRTPEHLSRGARHGHPASGLTAAAGVLFLVVPLLVELVTGSAFALMGLALVLLVTALPALHRLQDGRDGRPGVWGVRLAVGGLGALVLLILGAVVLAPRLSGTAGAVAQVVYGLIGAPAALAALVGVILFGLGLARARVLPARGAWVFLAGMALGLVSESFEQSLAGPVPRLADVLPVLGFVTAGAGLLLLARSARTVEDARFRETYRAPG